MVHINDWDRLAAIAESDPAFLLLGDTPLMGQEQLLRATNSRA